MQKYVKNYLDSKGLDEHDFIPCEKCGESSNDIHHIKAKGMGGSGKEWKDKAENLIALCREHHMDAHAYRITEEQLLELKQ